jgi:hypothetical protein
MMLREVLSDWMGWADDDVSSRETTYFETWNSECSNYYTLLIFASFRNKLLLAYILANGDYYYVDTNNKTKLIE